MPSYKLTYFNGRGRAETMRLIFAAAGQDYEDKRLEQADWAALKPSTPFGQMPVLEVDGVMLCQSNACARYLARKLNLAGKTDLEQAKADMIVDCVEDSTKPITAFFFEKDEARKAELKKKYVDEQLPSFLANFEKLLSANNGGDKFFVGSELTWADLAFISGVMWYEMAGISEPLAKYPKLKALKERVENLPKIAAWIEKRPKTQF